MPAAGYDSFRDRMIVFSGFTNVPGIVYHRDAWSLDLSGDPAWHELSLSGQPPPGRLRSGAAYDPRGDQLIVTAGREINYLMGDTWGLTFGSPVINVRLDVKPGDPQNVLPLHANGTLAAAILGDPTYPVTNVLIESVRLMGAPVQQRQNGTYMASFDDVDHDGEIDLVLHFAVADLCFRRTDTVATLTGRLTTGARIEGQDGIRILSAPRSAAPEADADPQVNIRVTSPWQRPRPLAVALDLPAARRVVVDLIDISGRRLATREIDGLVRRRVVEFSEPARWPSGVYFVRVTYEGWMRSTRFVLL